MLSIPLSYCIITITICKDDRTVSFLWDFGTRDRRNLAKIPNNDGLEMGGEENQFKLKALAFAHWTFNKFDGRLLVCDLQGKLKFPHFQENQFQHSN